LTPFPHLGGQKCGGSKHKNMKKNREQSDFAPIMIKLCCKVFLINNFQWKSWSGICLEENCEIYAYLHIYNYYSATSQLPQLTSFISNSCISKTVAVSSHSLLFTSKTLMSKFIYSDNETGALPLSWTHDSFRPNSKNIPLLETPFSSSEDGSRLQAPHSELLKNGSTTLCIMVNAVSMSMVQF